MELSSIDSFLQDYATQESFSILNEKNKGKENSPSIHNIKGNDYSTE